MNVLGAEWLHCRQPMHAASFDEYGARVRAPLRGILPDELGHGLTGVRLEIGAELHREVHLLPHLFQILVVNSPGFFVHEGVVSLVEDDGQVVARLARDVGVAPLLQLPVLALHVLVRRLEV